MPTSKTLEEKSHGIEKRARAKSAKYECAAHYQPEQQPMRSSGGERINQSSLRGIYRARM
jgi:hypothetical protein